MNKYKIIIILCLLFLVANLSAEENSLVPLPIGETISFEVHYLGMNVSIGSITVADTIEVNGRLAYKLITNASTTSIYGAIYHLRNQYISYSDIKRGYTLSYHKIIDETDWKGITEVYYYQALGVATYDDSVEVEILPNTHDFFGWLYHLRRLDFEENDILSFNLDIEGRPWQADVQVGELQTISIKDTTYSAFPLTCTFQKKYEGHPWMSTCDAISGNAFNENKKIIMWFSEDLPHLPLKAEFDATISKVIGTMVDYSKGESIEDKEQVLEEVEDSEQGIGENEPSLISN